MAVKTMLGIFLIFLLVLGFLITSENKREILDEYERCKNSDSVLKPPEEINIEGAEEEINKMMGGYRYEHS